MTRLIDADALVDQLEREAADEWNRNTPTNWANAFCVFVDRLDEAPTIDAAPVRRGEWKYEKIGGKTYCFCSECGDQPMRFEPNFCPNCGADMRKEEHHEPED